MNLCEIHEFLTKKTVAKLSGESYFSSTVKILLFDSGARRTDACFVLRPRYSTHSTTTGTYATRDETSESFSRPSHSYVGSTFAFGSRIASNVEVYFLHVSAGARISLSQSNPNQ